MKLKLVFILHSLKGEVSRGMKKRFSANKDRARDPILNRPITSTSTFNQLQKQEKLIANCSN